MRMHAVKKKKKKEEGETKTLNQIYVLLYKGRCSETQLKRERKIKRNKKKKIIIMRERDRMTW